MLHSELADSSRYHLVSKFAKLSNSTTILPIDFAGKDGSKVTTVVATPGQGPDRPQEVSYSDTKVIGNGSFGVVFQAKLCDNGELVAIKKVLQDKRFKVSSRVEDYAIFSNELFVNQNRELQIMRRLEHCNIVKLKYFFYSSGEKVSLSLPLVHPAVLSFYIFVNVDCRA